MTMIRSQLIIVQVIKDASKEVMTMMTELPVVEVDQLEEWFQLQRHLCCTWYENHYHHHKPNHCSQCHHHDDNL